MCRNTCLGCIPPVVLGDSKPAFQDYFVAEQNVRKILNILTVICNIFNRGVIGI